VGTNHISGTADRLRCCQRKWTVSVVNWWRSSVPVYHTDRRYLCTTRWARGTASRGSVSGSGDLFPRFVCVCVCVWLFSHGISIADVARLTKLNIEMLHARRVMETIYFGVERSKVNVTRHKNIAGVSLCTLVSAGFF